MILLCFEVIPKLLGVGGCFTLGALLFTPLLPEIKSFSCTFFYWALDQSTVHRLSPLCLGAESQACWSMPGSSASHRNRCMAFHPQGCPPQSCRLYLRECKVF